MKGDMKSMKDGCGTCCMGACPKCHAVVCLIIGIIFLINSYWPFSDWWMLIGILLVIKGVLKLLMPCCSHCK
ncbi:MAG: hypothetical protein AABY10_03895 [Nanoarchaeota archaeon]